MRVEGQKPRILLRKVFTAPVRKLLRGPGCGVAYWVEWSLPKLEFGSSNPILTLTFIYLKVFGTDKTKGQRGRDWPIFYY